MLFTLIKPMLLSTRTEPFNDNNYIFEPKADGFRILIHKEGNRIEAYTRHGNCITSKFPELEKIKDQIDAKSAILDCEGACFHDNQFFFDEFSHRGRLSNSSKIQIAASVHPATFFVFDILYRNGNDCLNFALMRRKELLEETVRPGGSLSIVPYIEGQGTKLFEQTKALGWEGAIGKRKDSLYTLNHRSPNWLKMKHWRTQSVVILGYRRNPSFALVVGVYAGDERYRPVATIEFGMKPEEKEAFLSVAQQIRTVKEKDIQWIEPRICAEVQYLERTEKGHLRIATFRKFLFGAEPTLMRFPA